jgi:3-hydroxybutyryl-CoA dehydratase
MYDIKAFDSLQPGDEVQTTRTITEADGALYIAATGDFGPVHIDDSYAATTRFGQRLAPGILVAGICTPVC